MFLPQGLVGAILKQLDVVMFALENAKTFASGLNNDDLNKKMVECEICSAMQQLMIISPV